MRKSVAQLATLSLAAGWIGLAILGGCDSKQRLADIKTEKVLDDSDKHAIGANTAEQLKQPVADADLAASISAPLQETLQADQKANQNKTYDPEMLVNRQLHTFAVGRQAQVHYERAMALWTDLQAKEADIRQLCSQIEMIAWDIHSSEQWIDSLNKYDEKPLSDAVVAKKAEVIGSKDQLTYLTPETDGKPWPNAIEMETDFKLKQTMDEQSKRIADDKKAIEDKSAARSQLLAQADDLTAKGAGETGKQGQDDSIAGANLRQKAAALTTEIDWANSDLMRGEAEYKLATNKEAVTTEMLKQLDDDIVSIQQVWEGNGTDVAGVKNQIDALKQHEKEEIEGTAAAQAAAQTAEGATGLTQEAPTTQTASAHVPHPPYVAEMGNKLVRLWADAEALRLESADEFRASIDQFKEAEKQAELVRADIQQLLSIHKEKPEIPVWKQDLETLSSETFALDRANAEQELASLYASQVETDLTLQRMYAGVTVDPKIELTQQSGLIQQMVDAKLLEAPKDSDLQALDATYQGDPKKTSDVLAKWSEQRATDKDMPELLVPGLTDTLDKAQIAMPAALKDLKVPDDKDLKTATDNADSFFATAADTYSTVSGTAQTPGSPARGLAATEARATLFLIKYSYDIFLGRDTNASTDKDQVGPFWPKEGVKLAITNGSKMFQDTTPGNAAPAAAPADNGAPTAPPAPADNGTPPAPSTPPADNSTPQPPAANPTPTPDGGAGGLPPTNGDLPPMPNTPAPATPAPATPPPGN